MIARVKIYHGLDKDEFFDAKYVLKQMFPGSKSILLKDEDNLTVIGECVDSVSEWISNNLSINVKEEPKRDDFLWIDAEGNYLKRTNYENSINAIILKDKSFPLQLNITTFEGYVEKPKILFLALKLISLNYPGRRIILACDFKPRRDVTLSLCNAFITRNNLRYSSEKVHWDSDDPNLYSKILNFCKRAIEPIEPIVPLENNFSVAAYEHIELIGKGSFGTVWLCRSLTSGKPVAIKQIPKASYNTVDKLASIKSELLILSKVRSNPHTVTLLNYGQDLSNIYFVCDYVIGGELFTRMRRMRCKMSENEARFFVAEIAVAIHSLHELGIIYRDLKPENVLITSSGHIMLTDFGFSCELEEGQKLSAFCGSPYYIAPEMITSAYDNSIDWWALGILMYELLEGHPPFLGSKATEIYRAILVGQVDWSNFKHRSEAQELIKGLLKNDPQKRFKYSDLQKSSWFRNLDWLQAESRSLEPPYVVSASSPFDTSCFVKYKRDEARFGPSVREF